MNTERVSLRITRGSARDMVLSKLPYIKCVDNSYADNTYVWKNGDIYALCHALYSYIYEHSASITYYINRAEEIIPFIQTEDDAASFILLREAAGNVIKW
jgi:hypothetical protein